MKTIWNIVSFLAVVNLLALSLAAGWLGWTGRLDEDRLAAVQEVFKVPTSEAARLVNERREVEAMEAEQALELQRWGQMPFSTAGAIDAQEQYRDLERLGELRLQRQAATLVDEIDQQAARRRTELAAREADVKRREAQIEAIERRSRDADFKVMVGDLEAMDVDAALAVIENFLARDKDDLVVDVLATLGEERRQELLEGFVDRGRPEMAGQLLLRLRDRTANGADGPEDADAVNADSPRNSASGAPASRFQG
ncbi:MAG: hypothetical protein O3A31_04510 [Planctomycetota bacterium]|jgi:hypothetical protein|nr:hypothetical protein [Planctomycetota bacterium]